MSSYKSLLDHNISKILRNETEINLSLDQANQQLIKENLALKLELSQVKDSHLFKLWPLYNWLKKIFIK